MAELLAFGHDAKNMTVTSVTAKSNGGAAIGLKEGTEHPELRLSAAEAQEVLAALTPPSPAPEPVPAPPVSSFILGATNVTAWGEGDARKFYEAGIRTERLGLEGSTWEYATLPETVEWGFRDNFVIVGNVEDNEPLGKVNIASWAKTLAEGVERQILPTQASTPDAVRALICGNEMYAKTAKGWSTVGPEPAVYAEMYLAALEALEAVGCTIPLLCNSTGEVSPTSGKVQWLEALVKAQPSIVEKAQGFNSHPYGRAGENLDGSGTGALEAQHALAVKLGFSVTTFSVDESGFAINPTGKEGRYVKTAAEQAEQIALYVAALEKMSFCGAYIYFQAHDFDPLPENAYGLIAGDSWSPRPSFTTFSQLCTSQG